MISLYQIGIRLMCGILGAALAGGIGWVASHLTVGMVLARHFDAGTHQRLEILWLAVCPIGGFLAGILFDRRWLNDQFRWISWGAVGSLAILAVIRVVLDHQIPYRKGSPYRILGMDISWDEVALLSAPAALLAGGFLGWFFHRRREQTDNTAAKRR